MVAEWSRDGPEMVTGLTRFTQVIICMLLRLIWKWVVIKFRCKGTTFLRYAFRFVQFSQNVSVYFRLLCHFVCSGCKSIFSCSQTNRTA